MALIKSSEAPKKVATALPKNIEDTINTNIGNGIRSWEMDEEWDFYKDDIMDNADQSGWVCKVEKKASPHDPEVLCKFIKFIPK
jgi:hypothetical protein